MDKKFKWDKYPQTDAEFDKLMNAIDKVLSDKGIRPFQRSIHTSRLLWEAFGWSGDIIPPKKLANKAGFRGDIIMAKAHRWYEEMYGEQNKADFVFGYAPVKLRNAVWKVRFGLIYGTVEFFVDRDLNNKGNQLGSGENKATSNTRI